MRMQPFFSYYGSKYRLGPKYPQPKYKTIIEPFAGSACYSIRHPDKQVVLYDLNPIICTVWDYLIHVSEEEILSLPTNIFNFDGLHLTQEQKWLIGHWFGKASPHPRLKATKWMLRGDTSMWCDSVKHRIARQVQYIRHWKVFNKSYECIDNEMATWFIDPPYNNKAGQVYTYNTIDYPKLADWCKDRTGQVIVCEQEGADWLPFESFRLNMSNKSTNYTEVLWYKEEAPTGCPVEAL